MTNGQTHVTLTPKLLEKIDEVAEEDFMTRGEFIKEAVREKLQAHEEWRALIAGVALNSPIPTENELFAILRQRQGSRATQQDQKDWRHEMRELSLRRKRKKELKDYWATREFEL
jgi:Arc/MetJ-type ribon-helix-helix transcriptional regulator